MTIKLINGVFSYRDLLSVWRKGVRNGNWVKLTCLERGLFRCAVSLAKLRGRIINLRLMVYTAKIALKLLALPKNRITQVGRAKAQVLTSLYALKGVFKWCPELKCWLSEPNYIFWLGLNSVSEGCEVFC
jgi:hypothetical protein